LTGQCGPKERSRANRLRSFYARPPGTSGEAAEEAMSPTTSLKSQNLRRTITINGHKTTISLEEAFWTSLKEIAATKNLRPSILVEAISGKSETSNLSSAIRLYVLDFYERKYEKSPVRRSTKH
jgi:predicted DNA-binding ribbon-helix-helix protein